VEYRFAERALSDLGSGAQRRLVEALKPARAPHEPAPKNGHGNLASTAARTHLDDGSTLH